MTQSYCGLDPKVQCKKSPAGAEGGGWSQIKWTKQLNTAFINSKKHASRICSYSMIENHAWHTLNLPSQVQWHLTYSSINIINKQLFLISETFTVFTAMPPWSMATPIRLNCTLILKEMAGKLIHRWSSNGLGCLHDVWRAHLSQVKSPLNIQHFIQYRLF